MIVAFCVKKARKFPIDMILLLVFILSFSYIVSFVCSAIVDSVDGPVVPIAIACTVAIALALTIYAFVCKGHWKLWIGILLVCLATVMPLAIVSFFVYMPILAVIISALLVVIYGIYLVIMTKMIIGKEVPGFPMDSPILASVILYMYIMKMFLRILVIIGILRR